MCGALILDSRFKYVLLKADTKVPVLAGWQSSFVKSLESGCDYGVLTGDGLVVIDVDVKNGKDGKASLARLEGYREVDLLGNYAVTTPTGGIHYYFRTDVDARNRVGALEGIDVRGQGGFVKQIGEGYQVHGGEVRLLPTWLGSIVFPSERARPSVGQTRPADLSNEDLRQLLSDVSADCDYESWRNIVWSCCAYGCADLAEEWSRKSEKFNQLVFDKVVNTFDPDLAMDDPLASFREARVTAPAPHCVGDAELQRFYPAVLPAMESASVETAAKIHASTLRFFSTVGQELPHGDHDRALHHLSEIAARMYYTNEPSRIVFPLFCGGGKTVTVAAMAKHRPSHRGLLIACGTVNALEELRDMMIRDFGVPAADIGCTHTKEGGESVDDAASKPIVLCTHQRVKGRRFDDLRYWWSEDARSLDYNGERVVVWDETLITTKTEHLPSKELFVTLGTYAAQIKHHAFKEGREPSPEELNMLNYLEEVERHLARAAPGEEIPLNGRPEEVPGVGIQDEVLRTLLRSGVSSMYISPQRDGITFRLEVDDHVENILVLDASAPIRHLARLDPTLKIVPVLANRDYSEVVIHWVKAKAGKVAIESPEQRGSLARWIFEHVASKHQSEPLLVLASPDGGERRDSLVEVGMIEGEDAGRFKLLSFGKSRALNSLTHYRVGVNFGISFREANELKTAIAGQKREPAASISAAEHRQVMVSESTDVLYQGLMRMACRQAENGRAKKVDFYLIHPFPEEVLRHLRQVMPGLRAEQLELEPAQPDPIQLRAAETLARLRPEDGLISYIGLRRRAGVNEVANSKPARKFNQSVEQLVQANSGRFMKRGKAVGVRPAS